MSRFAKRDGVELPKTETGHESRVRSVLMDLGPIRLPGDLVVPVEEAGVVVFAHGSGSSRHSPRNVWVAKRLQDAGLVTLLFDLLTDDEADNRSLVFDIDFLARRLEGAVGWVHGEPGLGHLPVGLFGASTGAAAALVAATTVPGVAAIVSRGGRPDLAGPALEKVTAPTLLIVGGADLEVLELNRRAQRALPGESRLEVVPGATHLFEEPGALERVAALAAGWFHAHLAAPPGPRGLVLGTGLG
jgi:putative phosphoribosyl transferase